MVLGWLQYSGTFRARGGTPNPGNGTCAATCRGPAAGRVSFVVAFPTAGAPVVARGAVPGGQRDRGGGAGVVRKPGLRRGARRADAQLLREYHQPARVQAGIALGHAFPHLRPHSNAIARSRDRAIAHTHSFA